MRANEISISSVKLNSKRPWFLLGILLSACAPGAAPTVGNEWQGTIETVGQRTIVLNTGGALWETPRELVEDLSIGVEEGSEEFMFGAVLGLAVTERLVYVVDYQVPAVRVFDHDGNYVGDVGREGEGPGEYLEPDSVALGSGGRVFVRETRRARIHVFSDDGSSLGHLPMEGGLFTRTPLTVTPDGDVYAPRLLDRDTSGGNWNIGMVPHTAEGPANDRAIVPTLLDFEPTMLLSRRDDGSVRRSDYVPYTPQHVWAMAPSGAIVVASSGDYVFEARHLDGTITEIHKYWAPVAVLAEEAAWRRRLVAAQFRRRDPSWVWDGAEIPEHKPAFAQFLPAASGNLWVLREGAGARVTPCTEDPEPGESFDPCWASPWHVDAFDAQGRFLGTFPVPREIGRGDAPSVITGDALWTTVVDDPGTITVRRYRLRVVDGAANTDTDPAR